MSILAGGPAMMGSLVACIHPHKDTAIDDVRLLFISAPAVFQININNIRAVSRMPNANTVCGTGTLLSPPLWSQIHSGLIVGTYGSCSAIKGNHV